MLSKFSSVVMLLWLCMFLWGSVAGSPQVLLQQGLLEGSYIRSFNGREVSAFRGIPYAKPPVGKHRFKEPIAAGPWHGVLNATRRPSDCLQYSHFNYMSDRQLHGQEDCLYLNVFTPKVEEGANFDVIVNIHGGAFMFHVPYLEEPSILLDRDVVLVTINYRLGPLGFLSTGDSVVPGNNGLKDQVLALKWVQANIHAFGGNPGKVTLLGLSAGGASVQYHLLSPLSKGIFHRAIILSGSALNPWAFADGLPEKSRVMASNLGCPTNDSFLLVRCLRDRQPEQIVQLSSLFQGYLYNSFSPFGPTVEVDSPSAFLSADPESILAQGLAHDVPILASFTSEEGLYPGAELVGVEDNLAHLRQHVRSELVHILDYNWTLPAERHLEVADKILNHYQVDLNTRQGEHNFIKVLGDRLFIHGLVKAARLHAVHSTSSVYLFRFSYRGTYSFSSAYTNLDLGVSHGDDMFYVMSKAITKKDVTESDRQLSSFLLNLWADFARNGSLSEPWSSLEQGKILDLRGPGQLEEYQDLDPGQSEFWDLLNLDQLPASQLKDEL